MRRRVVQEETKSETVTMAPDAAARTMALFPEAKPGADGTVETDAHGTVFVTHACGLKVSTGVLEQWGWVCNSCNKLVDGALKDAALKAKAAAAKNPPPPAPSAEQPLVPARRRAAAPESPIADAAKPKCPVCAAVLTETALGVFCPNGHDQKAALAAAAPPPSPVRTPEVSPVPEPRSFSQEKESSSPAPVADTVTLTWAREGQSPRQFHVWEVGPFTWTTTVRPGETHAQAAERLSKELTAFAEAERERKKASYLAAIGGK